MELYIYGWLTIDFYDSTDEKKIHFPPKISSLPAVSIIRTMMGKQTKRTTRRRIFDTEEREREKERGVSSVGLVRDISFPRALKNGRRLPRAAVIPKGVQESAGV